MSELTEIVRGGFDSDGCYLGDLEYVLKLCDEHERLEAAIDGTGDTAILTVNILRLWPAEERIAFALHLLGSEWKAPEHERLEAEHEAFMEVAQTDHRELRRLEGLLRAWAEAQRQLNIADMGDPGNPAVLAAEVHSCEDARDIARSRIYAEAVRLAKEKP